MASGVDDSPRPADCGLPADGNGPRWSLTVEGARTPADFLHRSPWLSVASRRSCSECNSLLSCHNAKNTKGTQKDENRERKTATATLQKLDTIDWDYSHLLGSVFQCVASRLLHRCHLQYHGLHSSSCFVWRVKEVASDEHMCFSAAMARKQQRLPFFRSEEPSSSHGEPSVPVGDIRGELCARLGVWLPLQPRGDHRPSRQRLFLEAIETAANMREATPQGLLRHRLHAKFSAESRVGLLTARPAMKANIRDLLQAAVPQICTAARQTAAEEHLTCTDEADIMHTLAMPDKLHANGHLFQDVNIMDEDDPPADEQGGGLRGWRRRVPCGRGGGGAMHFCTGDSCRGGAYIQRSCMKHTRQVCQVPCSAGCLWTQAAHSGAAFDSRCTL